MQGDFSRLAFDPDKGYRSVLLQQGRVLLDADWNEQVALTAYHDEIRSRDTIGAHGGPADGGGFAIVGSDRKPLPTGIKWEDLRITPGPYYVDGVRCEASLPGDSTGLIPLRDQPYLAAIGADPGLPEPATDGRYALYLDAWTHHVTSDDDPALWEPALGGPDTTTRTQTVWQVRVTEKIEDAKRRSNLSELLAVHPRGRMSASLIAPTPDADPCRIATAGGYTRLENQLYRVQVHDVTPTGPRFLWSRENGSVVAALLKLTPTGQETAELQIDRPGRDDELSIRAGDIVEVTSTSRVLRGQPGYLATVEEPDGLRLPVTWQGDHPQDFVSLGRPSVVRRWEALVRPQPTISASVGLEGGIQVTFSPGEYRTGDYWLLPARAPRLAYGLTTSIGTILWPVGKDQNPVAREPHGPAHHLAPLAFLSRTASNGTGRWTVESDCRRLTPALTEMITLDLLGGDGQEAPGGQPLPHPIRVAVRNGGRAVSGAPVRFTASDGGTFTDGTKTLSHEGVPTDLHGIAEARWTLNKDGRLTQTLTAQRLDESGEPTGAEVIVTGRLSVDRSGITITLSPTLSEEGKNWRHTNGFATKPAAISSLKGVMSVALPDGYRISSFRATGNKPSGTMSIVLQSHALGEPAPLPIVLLAPTNGQFDRPEVPNQNASSRAEIKNESHRYYVSVEITDAASSEIVLESFQIRCKPI